MSGAPPTLIILPGPGGTQISIDIVPFDALEDSSGVTGLFEDPHAGDMRWSLGHREQTNLGYKKKRKHHLYCPNGTYFHPSSGRKTHIYGSVGIVSFLRAHRLWDPAYNDASPWTVAAML